MCNFVKQNKVYFFVDRFGKLYYHYYGGDRMIIYQSKRVKIDFNSSQYRLRFYVNGRLRFLMTFKTWDDLDCYCQDNLILN